MSDRTHRQSPLLVFGGGGMVGRAVAAEAESRGMPVVAVGHADVDITDRGAVQRCRREVAPALMINCAAVTDVDGCESRRDEALEVNGRAVANLVAAAREEALPLVHVSSDYVFDGRADLPYVEETETAPASVYGRSKLLGEHEALGYRQSLVVRTSWLFGPDGRNFVSTVCRIARRDGVLRVVSDQVGCPTYTPFLARAILDLTELGASGVVHYRNRDAVSWFEFARAILEIWGIDAEITPVATSEFLRPAPRPSYSVLDVRRFESAVGRPVEAWRRGLEAYHGLGSEGLESVM